MEGLGESLNEDGIYKGHWKQGMHNGQGEFLWNDGFQYIGSWKQGLRDG